MNDCAIIILGATGDLSRKKIFPALYRLFAQKKLGNSIIIGAAIDSIEVSELLNRCKEFVNPDDAQQWHDFCNRVFYTPIDFLKENDFFALEKYVVDQEKKAKLSGNRLVYCATAPFFYCMITKGLAESGLVKSAHLKQAQEWQRIVFEKPFGHDKQSAQEINTCIANHFDERQIFRIDHYLSKALVNNIALVRFTNIIFEPLWNNRYIDQVQIIFDEKTGLEGRGVFYDKYGALADVMQNHMMQLLALIGMEAPEKLTGDYIRIARANVLKKVKVVDAILGQYKGYQQEPGVAPHSKTETFAQVLLRIENHRWAGVPFYLRTGKYLKKKETVIYIKFKQVDCLLSKNCPSESNYLTIKISPESVFSLTLNVKTSAFSDNVKPVQMHFSHGVFPDAQEAYEILLQEILKGEASISVRFDEIEYAWNIIDAIRALNPTLYEYEKESNGPEEARTIFDTKHGIRWKS